MIWLDKTNETGNFASPRSFKWSSFDTFKWSSFDTFKWSSFDTFI